MSQYDALVWNEEQIIAFAGIVCSIQREIVDTSQGLATVKQEVQGGVENVLYSSFAIIFDRPPADRNNYTDIFDQIADFATHLAKDHIFPDANKRTTVLTCVALLRNNGIILDIEDSVNPFDNALYKWIQNIVEGKIARASLAEQLRSHAHLLSNEVNY